MTGVSRSGPALAAGRPPLAAIARMAIAAWLGWLTWGAGAAPAAWQDFRGSRDGLADSQVLAIHEDDDGTLWFGTPRGPSRFDGLRWSSPDLGTVNPVVQCLTAAGEGRLWLGLQGGGAVLLDPASGAHSVLSTAGGGLPSDNVQAILIDHAGDTWFGTPNGLARRAAGSGDWNVYRGNGDGLVHPNAWRLLEDRDDNLWIGTPEGLSRLAADRLTWTSWRADPAALGRDSVLAIGEDTNGDLWFGTDGGAWRLSRAGGAESWRHFGATEGLASAAVLAIEPDGAGGAWFGGTAGIDHWDGATWRHYGGTTEGLPLGRVFSLTLDRSGNLWAGTQSNGLFRYDRVDIQGLIAPPGSGDCSSRPDLGGLVRPVLASNCVTGIIEDHAGEIWATTADRGVARLDATGAWRFEGRAPGRPLSDSLSTLIEDRTGRIWFASGNVAGAGRYAGIAVLGADRTTWTSWRGRGALPNDNVLALHEGADGTVWAGTAAGLAAYADGAWRQWLTPEMLGFDLVVHAIAEDGLGGLWLRTFDGVYRLDPADGIPRRLGPADGLWTDDIRVIRAGRGGDVWVGGAGGFARWREGRFEPSPVTTDDVESIRVTRDGRLWVGTVNGAYRVDSNGQAEYFPGEVIGSAPVTGIDEDASGTIWLATFGGMSRYNGTAWNRFTGSDGLVSDQIAHFLEDRRGRLWLASFSGISQYDPDVVAPQSVFVTAPPRLSSSRNARFIHAAAYGEVTDVEFVTSLDGVSSGWSPNVTVEFGGLADGAHTLVVSARDWSGNVDPTPARYDFEVDATPPEAVIAAPSFGQAVRGALTVRGTAADARFRRFDVAARPAGTPSWTDAAVVHLAGAALPVPSGALAEWDTAPLPDGDWELRLVVEDTLGLAGTAQVRVTIDNRAPFAEVTSPVRVTAFQGGDVWTTNEEVHCYFPPRAFAMDAVVTITPAPVDGAAADGGAADGPGTVAWDIDWGAPRLDKAGVLDLGMPGEAGDAMAVHRSEDGGRSWSVVGGTPDAAGTRLVAVIDRPGRYALFPAGSAPIGGARLAGPVLIPRVFTPLSGAPGALAISFTLDQPAPASVTVFNRAGRRVRELADGASMAGGVNVLHWDGRDDDGAVVTDGLYLVRIESREESRVSTLVVRR